MATPINKAGEWFGKQGERTFAPVTNAIGRMMGKGNEGAMEAPTTPPPPPQAGPPQSPTGTRNNTQQLAKAQLSFLTAASKAAAAMGTGAATGKTLLGQ